MQDFHTIADLLFFSKAYKLVYKVYEFKHKKSQMLAENIVIATKEYNKQDNKDKKDLQCLLSNNHYNILEL